MKYEAKRINQTLCMRSQIKISCLMLRIQLLCTLYLFFPFPFIISSFVIESVQVWRKKSFSFPFDVFRLQKAKIQQWISRIQDVRRFNQKSKFEFKASQFFQAKVFKPTTMIKIDFPVQKRFRSSFFASQDQNKLSKRRNIANKELEGKNAQKFISQDTENQKPWKKCQEEDLMVLVLQSFVQEPYLQFFWENLQQHSNLSKICKKLKRSKKSCSTKIIQIKSVYQQNYSDLDVVEFLLAYWKSRDFKNKEGRELVQKIKKMRGKQSDHMKMCDQMIKNLSQRQESFMSLYDVIMKN